MTNIRVKANDGTEAEWDPNTKEVYSTGRANLSSFMGYDGSRRLEGEAGSPGGALEVVRDAQNNKTS